MSFSPESGKPRAAIRLRRCCWRRKSCVRTRRGGACLALWPAVRGWRWSGFTPAGAGQASASPSRSRTWRLPFHRPRGALPAFPLPHVSVPSRGPEGCFQGDAGQRRTAISLGRTRPLTAWLLASRRRDLAEQSWGTADLLQPVRAGSSIPLLSSETDLTHGSLPWSRRRCRPLSDLCLSDPTAFLLPLPTAAALLGSLLFLHRLTSFLPQGLCSRALVSASPGSLSSSPS